jgi:5-methylcytosine-specific restriction enzyme subunit McrC
MPNKKNTITVFEHQSLYVHKGENRLLPGQLKALQLFYKEKDFPFYSLVHNGIKFCEYVGVIQVGNIVIEVLPKVDTRGKDEWRKLLIDMLRKAGIFDMDAPTNSTLKTKPNSILDLYFELFIRQAENILHKGLVKRYRKVESNLPALKGAILFSRHIQQNLIHKELFYTRHSTYDQQHLLNCLLYKTIKLLKSVCSNPALNSRIGSLLLNFPEMPDITVNESIFLKIEYNRKIEHYKQAIDIARLLLLNFHPDIITGKNDVLALLFDMNELWERFVLKSLQKGLPVGYKVKAQTRKLFWKKEGGYAKKMIPDIVVIYPDETQVVLDTKWKNIGDWNPSDEDLRQMYAYSKFHQNAITALVYPSEQPSSSFIRGNFYNEETNNISSSQQCGIVKLAVAGNVTQWQREISAFILQAMQAETANLY